MNTNSIVTGVLFILIGIIFLASPIFSIAFISCFVGAGLLVSGISAIVAWNQVRKVRPCGGILAFAILAIILAILCITCPLVAFDAMATVMAIAVLIMGIGRIITTVSTPFIGGTIKVACILSGVLDVLFGVLALANSAFVLYFLAAGMIISGVTTIFVGIAAKNAAPIDVNPL